ncbi:hypothetical protein [Streptomyces sp. 891-h]|uniref:hypothetical protein n=1 Tax=Streptomyces sp. 891-h TaxID=2720714 RepID=UPI001FAA3609|nr:hypothetical protein [Streptomyces sp. 891-h]UNZ19452.1 hypothetical protein HC362_22830 [Streptomyces sp. 891-h]
MAGTEAHEADEAVHTAQAAVHRDPAVGLRAVAALRRLAERLEALQVDSARHQGWSWDEIGAALGVSRQAVHKKHANRTENRAGNRTGR